MTFQTFSKFCSLLATVIAFWGPSLGLAHDEPSETSFYLFLKAQPFTNTPTPFQTDGCTQSLDSWHIQSQPSWVDCCIEHDIAHWSGGSSKKRWAADNRLRTCMNHVGGPGNVYFRGVRLFGHPLAQPVSRPEPGYRNYPWGFGWNHYQGETPLNEMQKAAACEGLDHWMQTPAYERFLRSYRQLQGQDPIVPDCD